MKTKNENLFLKEIAKWQKVYITQYRVSYGIYFLQIIHIVWWVKSDNYFIIKMKNILPFFFTKVNSEIKELVWMQKKRKLILPVSIDHKITPRHKSIIVIIYKGITEKCVFIIFVNG